MKQISPSKNLALARVTRHAALKKLGVGLAGMALAGALFVLTIADLNADPRPAVNIMPLVANAGVRVVFTPTSDPLVARANLSGIVQTLQLGSFLDDGEVEVRFPTTPGDPATINGTATWTSLDGANSLSLTVSGTASPDPANPLIYNAAYRIGFAGGTGNYSGASGLAELTEVIRFTSQTNATTAWNLKGFLTTPKH